MPARDVLDRIAAWLAWLKPRVKDFINLHKHLNFIMYHYIYLVGMTILGSVVLYPELNLAYIDALFFSAGASTQSGLNTVDLNKLATYQQVVLMLMACVCNPIFINLMVVFIRLYWFEKRFEHVIEERVNARKTKSKSRSKSEAKGDNELSKLEMGVAGRPITVLHETTKPNGMSGSSANMKAHEMAFVEKLGLNGSSRSASTSPPNGSEMESGESSSDATARDREDSRTDENEKPMATELSEDPDSPSAPHHLGLNSRLLNRGITFADDLPRPATQPPPRVSSERMPRGREMSHHVAFVEKQKSNAKEGATTLRIPGPRDFDRGEVPKQLEDTDGGGLARRETRNTLHPVTSEHSQEDSADQPDEKEAEANPARRGITIDVPDHPAHRQREQTFEDSGEGNAEGNRFGLGQIVSNLRHRGSRHHGVDIEGRKSTNGRTFNSITTARTREKMEDPMPYLSWQPTLGRNSAFVNLTDEQREELGGIEYRALKTLRNILIFYYLGNHLLGIIVFLPWILTTSPWRGVVTSDGISPAWWGIFTPASLFNDLGYTLTPDSMYSFATASLMLTLGSGLILIGNTGFPVYLRFIIWFASKVTKNTSDLWEELRFLLDHPRRCFTLLFPTSATWWLFWILVALNTVDLVLFIILDLHDQTVTSIATKYRVLDGWFQATSTRTAGFSVLNLADLHPAVQVSYMIMMYISVFPIAISVRRTNVYEEKSLGIWGGDEEGDEQSQSYVGHHLRRQLSFDLWFVFLGFFIICIVEGGRLSNTNQYAFTMFSVLFEIVSAYGTVGLSLGYPGINASFSAEFKTISKLVIIAMMLRGRHRGLPYALDRAVLLPSENLNERENEDANLRHERRNTVFSENPDGDLRRRNARDDPDFDDAGFPRYQSGFDGQESMVTGALGLRSGATAQRRNSGFSTVSQMDRHRRQRSMSIGRIVASGLSAGPTFSKAHPGRQPDD